MSKSRLSRELASTKKKLEETTREKNSAEVREQELKEKMEEAKVTMVAGNKALDKAMKEADDNRQEMEIAVNELRKAVREKEEVQNANVQLAQAKEEMSSHYKRLKKSYEDLQDQSKLGRGAEVERLKDELNKLREQLSGAKARNRSMGSEDQEDMSGSLTLWTEIEPHMDGILQSDFNELRKFWIKELGPRQVFMRLSTLQRMAILEQDPHRGKEEVASILNVMIKENDYLDMAKTFPPGPYNDQFRVNVYNVVDRQDHGWIPHTNVIDVEEDFVTTSNTFNHLARVIKNWTDHVNEGLRRDIGEAWWDEEKRMKRDSKKKEMKAR